jgi:hypothetical protein
LSETIKYAQSGILEPTPQSEIYANLAQVRPNAHDFQLIFGRYGLFDEAPVVSVGSVVMSPLCAKQLAINLLNAVKQYEETLGPIQLPPPPPAKEEGEEKVGADNE